MGLHEWWKLIFYFVACRLLDSSSFMAVNSQLEVILREKINLEVL